MLCVSATEPSYVVVEPLAAGSQMQIYLKYDIEEKVNKSYMN